MFPSVVSDFPRAESTYRAERIRKDLLRSRPNHRPRDQFAG